MNLQYGSIIFIQNESSQSSQTLLLSKETETKFFSYAKKGIEYLAIWQHWCFGQFDHSKIEK